MFSLRSLNEHRRLENIASKRRCRWHSTSGACLPFDLIVPATATAINMTAEFVGKTILVTGAGGGIGKALCKQLADAGAKVFAVVRSEAHVQKINEGPSNIVPLRVDLTDWNAVRERLAEVPQLDGLVNNAGVAVIKPVEQLNELDFDLTFDVNIKAVFNVTQVLLPKLKAGASIVNVSSLAASRSFHGHAIYSATKAALDSLTRSLALELGARRIRVNSVNPTVVLTRMGRENWSDPKKSGPLLSHIPLERFCEEKEVTDAIAYLLGERSSFVNGSHINLDGGYSIS